MLEIFATLFGGIQPEGLLIRGSGEAAQAALRREARGAPRAARQAPPRQAAKHPRQRHPRFGGVFTKTFDDGLKQCSVAGAKQKDLLGPVSAAAKTGAKKVREAMPAQAMHRLAPAQSQGCKTGPVLALPVLRTRSMPVTSVSAQDTEEAQVHFAPEMSGLLSAYVDRFLQSSYNILMTGLQKDLSPGINISRLSKEDFLRFFKLTSFFTRYVRLQEVVAPLSLYFRSMVHLADCLISTLAFTARLRMLMLIGDWPHVRGMEEATNNAGGQAREQGSHGKQEWACSARCLLIRGHQRHPGLGDVPTCPLHMADSH